MIVKLLRHSFPDDPEWMLIHENVPIGTEYEILGYKSNIRIINKKLGKERLIDCYIVRRVDRKDSGPGMLPAACFMEKKDD